MSTGSVTVSFVYDGLGRRVSKTVTGLETPVSIHYYWDGWELLADDSPGNGYLRTYLWNPAHPRGYRTLLGYRDDAESNKMAMQIATTDANGSVLYMTDSTTGTVAAQFEYGPFGESLRATGVKAAACPIRYSSEYWDAETELYYYGHRYYSPRLGRWLSKDPIEEQGGINLYNFVGNNSVNKHDVKGLYSSELYAWGLLNCWCLTKVYDLRSKIIDKMVNLYGKSAVNTDGSIVNAIQHCTLTCYVASRCSVAQALNMGKAYENGMSDQPALMDLYNNNVGAYIGGENLDDCAGKCEEAARNKKLRWYNRVFLPGTLKLPTDINW